jgi:hypothetical protein
MMDAQMPTRIWNGDRWNYRVKELVPLPSGYSSAGRCCPECGSGTISGAIILNKDGSPAIVMADRDDPSMLCVDCGYWADLF